MKATVLGLVLWLGVVGAARAQNTNQVLGQVNFEGKTNIDKSSGVWVDGQYLGYVGRTERQQEASCSYPANTK